jgi:hypothetical protein
MLKVEDPMKVKSSPSSGRWGIRLFAMVAAFLAISANSNRAESEVLPLLDRDSSKTQEILKKVGIILGESKCYKITMVDSSIGRILLPRDMFIPFLIENKDTTATSRIEVTIDPKKYDKTATPRNRRIRLEQNITAPLHVYMDASSQKLLQIRWGKLVSEICQQDGGAFANREEIENYMQRAKISFLGFPDSSPAFSLGSLLDSLWIDPFSAEEIRIIYITMKKSDVGQKPVWLVELYGIPPFIPAQASGMNIEGFRQYREIRNAETGEFMGGNFFKPYLLWKN